MAISIIERDLKEAIGNYSDRKLRALLSKTEIHEITITDDQSAAAFVDGTENIMRGAKYSQDEINAVNSEYNTLENWRQTVHSVYGKLSSLPNTTVNHKLRTIDQLYKSSLQGVYLLSHSTPSAMVIRLYNDVGQGVEQGDTNLDTFLGAYRRLCWNTWRDTFLPDSSGLKQISVEKGAKRGTRFRRLSDPAVGPIQGEQQQGRYASAAFGAGSPFAHDHESTVGSIGLQRILEQLAGDEGSQELQEALNYKGLETISQDIVADVKNTLQLDFSEEEVELPNGNTRIARVVRGKLRKQDKELSDWNNIKQQILKEDGSLAKVISDTVAAMNEDQALAAEGSRSVKKRMGQKAAKKVVDNLTKKKRKTTKVVKRPKYKKPAPKKASAKRSGRGGSRKRRTNYRVAIAGKKLIRPEQEKRKAAQSVISLTGKINKRLPAEVRRNMGRPALINQTGIFSNSVELVSLRHTKAGLSGEYTYMRTGGGTSKNRRGVYETFESSGRKTWPAGYNPKPLIAKSIRNLAMQYTEQKLVSLRRI